MPWLGVEATPDIDTLASTPKYVHLVPLTASGGVPTSEAGEKISHVPSYGERQNDIRWSWTVPVST